MKAPTATESVYCTLFSSLMHFAEAGAIVETERDSPETTGVSILASKKRRSRVSKELKLPSDFAFESPDTEESSMRSTTVPGVTGQAGSAIRASEWLLPLPRALEIRDRDSFLAKLDTLESSEVLLVMLLEAPNRIF